MLHGVSYAFPVTSLKKHLLVVKVVTNGNVLLRYVKLIISVYESTFLSVYVFAFFRYVICKHKPCYRHGHSGVRKVFQRPSNEFLLKGLK